MEVHWSAWGRAYVTPVDDTRSGWPVLSTRPGGFDELIGAFPALADRLAGADLGRCAGPARSGNGSAALRGRVLLVGDAAGYVDALTGEGLVLGLAQARAAGRGHRSGHPAGYGGCRPPARAAAHHADPGPAHRHPATGGAAGPGAGGPPAARGVRRGRGSTGPAGLTGPPFSTPAPTPQRPSED